MLKSGIVRSEEELKRSVRHAGYLHYYPKWPDPLCGEQPESYPCIIVVGTGWDSRRGQCEPHWEYVYPSDFAELDYYSKPIADAAKAWRAAREAYLTIRTEDLRIKEQEALHKLNWMIDAEKNGWDTDYYEPEPYESC